MLGKYCKNTKVHKVAGKCQTSWAKVRTIKPKCTKLCKSAQSCAKVHKDEGKFTKLSEIVQSWAKVH